MFRFKETRECEINAISFRNGLRRYDHVTHIGNNLQRWRLSRLTAIDRIESTWESYYMVHPGTGERIYLGICHGETHWPYLRTRRGNEWSDGLLVLDVCDETCRLLS